MPLTKYALLAIVPPEKRNALSGDLRRAVTDIANRYDARSNTIDESVDPEELHVRGIADVVLADTTNAAIVALKISGQTEDIVQKRAAYFVDPVKLIVETHNLVNKAPDNLYPSEF